MPQKTKPQNQEPDGIDQEEFESMPVAQGEASFVLSRLEVYNWGPFRGMHRADFDSRGTAIDDPPKSNKPMTCSASSKQNEPVKSCD